MKTESARAATLADGATSHRAAVTRWLEANEVRMRLASAAYLPATAFPAALSDDGLPIGLQAIGAEFNDHTTIAFARLCAAETGVWRAPPLAGPSPRTPGALAA